MLPHYNATPVDKDTALAAVYAAYVLTEGDETEERSQWEWEGHHCASETEIIKSATWPRRIDATYASYIKTVILPWLTSVGLLECLWDGDPLDKAHTLTGKGASHPPLSGYIMGRLTLGEAMSLWE